MRHILLFSLFLTFGFQVYAGASGHMNATAEIIWPLRLTEQIIKPTVRFVKAEYLDINGVPNIIYHF